MKHWLQYAIISTLLAIDVTASANTIVLENKSDKQAIKITGRVMRQKAGEAPMQVSTFALSLNANDQKVQNIDLAGSDKAGIVIDSINGHALPKALTQFDRLGCNALTSKQTANNRLALTYQQTAPHQASLKCNSQAMVK